MPINKSQPPKTWTTFFTAPSSNRFWTIACQASGAMHISPARSQKRCRKVPEKGFKCVGLLLLDQVTASAKASCDGARAASIFTNLHQMVIEQWEMLRTFLSTTNCKLKANKDMNRMRIHRTYLDLSGIWRASFFGLLYVYIHVFNSIAWA